MGRTKDSFWNYAVEEPNDRFRCKFCSRVFAGGIPRIKSHLSGVKGRGIGICTEVPKDVQVAARSAVDGTSLEKTKFAVASCDVETNVENMPTSSQFVKPSRPHSSANAREKEQVMLHTQLARFLMSNGLALDVVESQSFIDFVKGVAGCVLNYKLPSSKALKTEFLPNLEKEVEAYVKDVRESRVTTGCTIMLDIGTESINLYAYCPKGVVLLDSYNRAADVDVNKVVAAAIEDIGSDHVVQFITNRASAFRSVGELLDSRFPRIYRVRCIANMLRLLFKDIYKKVELVEGIIACAELIVEHIYGDVALLSLMKRYTDNRELKHPCSGAFASNYQMLRTVMQNEAGLRRLVESEEWGSLASNKTKRATEVEDIVRARGFWRDGRYVLEALEPLIQVLRMVEGNGATSGYLYASMKIARKAIEERCQYNDVVSEIVLNVFDRRRNNILHPVHAAAAFLNPSYMFDENFEEDSVMKDGIDYIMEKMIADDHERQQFGLEIQLYRRKVPKLFSRMAKEMLRTYHPSVWWDYYGDCLPVLKKYAIRILSQPCKCLWEHQFSGKQVAGRRKIDGGLRMNMNVKLMEIYTNLRANLLGPISPENCSKLPNYDDRDSGRSDDIEDWIIPSSAGCSINGEEESEEETAMGTIRDTVGQKRFRQVDTQQSSERASTRVCRMLGEQSAAQGEIISPAAVALEEAINASASSLPSPRLH